MWKKILRYVLINGLFAGSIYFGYFGEVEGAKNIAYFMAWILGISGTLVLVALSIDKESFLKTLGENDATSSPIPMWFDATFDVVVISIFVWSGHYILGTFLVLALVGSYNMRKMMKEYTFELLKRPASE